jgi:group I intron endonuclease
MKAYFIYKLTCAYNGKVYIGASCNPENRLKQHRYAARRGAKQLLYHAMRKHGVTSFDMQIIYGSLNKNHIFAEMEPYFIKLYASNSVGYNLTSGGEGANTLSGLSEEQKLARAKKISISLKGRVRSIEHKKHISIANKGVSRNRGRSCGPLSEVTKMKMSAAHKHHAPWNKGKKCGPAWNKGIPMTKEHRKKQSEAIRLWQTHI